MFGFALRRMYVLYGEVFRLTFPGGFINFLWKFRSWEGQDYAHQRLETGLSLAIGEKTAKMTWKKSVEPTTVFVPSESGSWPPAIYDPLDVWNSDTEGA